MSLTCPADPWSQEVRRQAYVAVRVATAKRAACERTFRYYLNAAQAHGLTVAEVAEAARLPEAAVLALTDPAVCG